MSHNSDGLLHRRFDVPVCPPLDRGAGIWNRGPLMRLFMKMHVATLECHVGFSFSLNFSGNNNGIGGVVE